jgi:hypothetical protein
MEGFCEHGNEPWGSIKSWETLSSTLLGLLVYNYNPQRKYEMGRACSTRGEKHAYRILFESQKQNLHYEDLGVGGRIMLKWILEK